MTRALALAALLAAASAQAQLTLGDTETVAAQRTESPRSALIEVKLGGLVPLIDRSFSTSPGPFASAFGANATMLLGELEYDHELFQGFGTFAVGLAAGYAEKYAATTYTDLSGNTATSAESTGLVVVPLRALAIYRFDYLLSRWRFPLVPYGKLGFVYTPWWTTKGSATAAQGGKSGYCFVGGLSFVLDALEPRLAKDFDTDLGVNHTYLFAEFVYENVNDFGARGLDLSSRHFMFGLAFEL